MWIIFIYYNNRAKPFTQEPALLKQEKKREMIHWLNAKRVCSYFRPI